jgi:sugar lactone lactonase YvrE
MKMTQNCWLGKRFITVFLLILLNFGLGSAWAADVEFVPLATIKRGLTYPTDMAVSPDGKVYVVDGLARKVLTYDGNYQYIGSITSIESPVSVAVSPSGIVYVADNQSKSVKMLNSAGTVIGDLKKSGTTATFELPRNIAVGSDNRVYVVDQFGDSIEIFDAAGSHQGSITGLVMPQDIAVSTTALYIVDQPQVADGAGSTLNGSRLQVYDLAGNPITADYSFPSFGNDTDSGEYVSLKGISIDPHGYVYVSDSFLQVVYKYDGNGVFQGPINDSFATPLGVTVSADGRLFATSSYDGQVKVFGVDQVAGANTWMNDAPVASAGTDIKVDEGTPITLDGSGSIDNDGIADYMWTQTSGIPVLAENPYLTESPSVSLTAPNVGPEGAELNFKLVVTDTKGKASAVDTVKVTVNNLISGSVTINGGVLITNNQVVSLTLDSLDAVEMRFANDDDLFTGDYYPYTTSGNWTLSEGDGDKVVNVEFKDGSGNTATTSSIIKLDTEAPDAPEPIDLIAVGGEFNWQPVDDAVSYTFQYATNSDFTGAETISDIDYNGMTMAFDGFAAGNWYWRVQAVDEAGNTGAWSAVGTFRVGPDCQAAPEIPQLVLPFNDTEDASRTVMLETQDMVYSAECGEHLRTEWQVSGSQDFKSLVMHVGTTLDNLTAYQVPILVLEPETAYFWRVKQVASNGKQSDWSAALLFTTRASYDVQGENGVLYVQPEDEPADASGAEISIKAVVGDAGIKIKTIRMSVGGVIQIIQDIDPNSIPDAVNKPIGFPLGLLSLRVAVQDPGSIVQIKVMFSDSAPGDAEWYGYNAEVGWHVYEGAVFSKRRKSVTLNFQDGGLGDTDGVANGIIVNP